MNSKAIKRQLLAAIAMVLVAAIALGSSTYAWFVASGTVEATGMKVQAKSEGGIAIRWAGETSELWGTTASAKMNTAKELLPASTADLAKWTYAKAKSASSSAADPGTYTPITSTVFNGSNGAFTANDYVVMQPFEIRSTASDRLATGLYVSDVTITRGQNKDLDPAIRVGVRMVTTDGYTGNFIYAPIDGHSTGYTWKDASSNNNPTTVTLSQVGNGTDGNSQLVASGTTIPYDKGSAIKVQIFIWYEGEDSTLFSNNYAANGLSVTVKFSSNGFNNSTSGGGASQPSDGPVDLSSGTVISGTATQAKASVNAETTTSYYAIEGMTTPNGDQLYTDANSRNGLTKTSAIYTISGSGESAVASAYNNVTLPN